MGQTRCRNAGRFYLSGDTADGPVWFPLNCHRWDCPAPSCGGLKRAAAAEQIVGGVRRAFDAGERVRFITLTAPSRGMSLQQLGDGWRRMLSSLRPSGEVREYVGVVELQRRGEPHLHLLATGEFIHYKRLSKLARGGAGVKGRFGRVAWIEEVTPVSAGEVSLAGYFTKELQAVGAELASYITKVKAEQLREFGMVKGGRKRPLRRSDGWYPGGQAVAEAAVKRRWYPEPSAAEQVKGDWRMYEVRPDTGEVRFIKVMGAAETAPVLPLPLRPSLVLPRVEPVSLAA